jgi:hypothetical protein
LIGDGEFHAIFGNRALTLVIVEISARARSALRPTP